MPYTIRIRDQITPMYVTRTDPVTGQQVERYNRVPAPANPQSFVRLIYSPLTTAPNLIYDQPIVELWEDVNGAATWDEIKSTGVLAYLQSIIKAEAKQCIEKKWPLWAQNNCALGIYGSATIDQCKSDIAAVIAASNTAEDAITNATSLDAAIAVQAVWPKI